jgi:FG-GAP repeat
VALHYSVGGRLASPGGSIYQANPETNDGFGSALAGGSFDGITPSDLAVGAPGETVNGAATAGAVDIFTGTASGISGTNPREFYQGGAAASGAEAGDRFGASLAAGPFRGSGELFDLAIGAPGEDLAQGGADAGQVNVHNGSASGLQDAVAKWFTQSSTGVGGGAEAGDQFGNALARGIFFNDFNGDGFADLAVGVYGEDIGASADDAGAVNVLGGSAGGPVGISALFYQGSGLGGGAQLGDRVGSAVD